MAKANQKTQAEKAAYAKQKREYQKSDAKKRNKTFHKKSPPFLICAFQLYHAQASGVKR